MKIRTGFVSNSSSSSYIILLKNNTYQTLMFNDFLKLIYPDIAPCVARFYQKENVPVKHLTDLLYNHIHFKIKPGFNRYTTINEEGGSNFDDEILYMLDKCHDPKKRFEWTIQMAGNLINDLETKDVTWEAGFGKDAYRKKKTIKSKPKRKVIKKIVKICRCK